MPATATPIALNGPLDRDQTQSLLDTLRQLLQSGDYPPGALVRAESPVTNATPLAWLQAQSGRTHYYWANRDGDFEMAGIGEADVLVPDGHVDTTALFSLMRHRLALIWPSLRYYGGFCFQESDLNEQRWHNFKAYRFIVPRIEVVRRGERVWLACNARCGTDEAQAEELSTVAGYLSGLAPEAGTVEAPLPPIVGRVDLPDRAAWKTLVHRALDAFAEHRLEKVVLARETELRFDTDSMLDPIGLLRRLLRHTTHSYEFCFHPSANRAFLGASPERLFHRNNVYLQSEALAGTRPRGDSDAADSALGDALLRSDKDLREHRFVVRCLRDHFQRFCTTTNHDSEPSLMRLRNCQHLHTRMEGILKQPDVDAALLDAFHPTPAVGGVPRQQALDWLAENEPFDRGVYAAPVGWVGFDETEFCVGIRSGLIEGNTLALYSGAGIVPGSSAEEEWDEIENKMSNFLEALHDGPG
ncbi:MAG: isochorismate synthase [Candidatus Hydrogenedentes bacterium]|nr:isochorismate synthase [Candidatus Hydrogenedentota bacterium]